MEGEILRIMELPYSTNIFVLEDRRRYAHYDFPMWFKEVEIATQVDDLEIFAIY